MNKLLKVSIVAVAFAFIAGCAGKCGVQQPAPVEKAKPVHVKHHCKGKRCYDKLGTETAKDTIK